MNGPRCLLGLIGLLALCQLYSADAGGDGNARGAVETLRVEQQEFIWRRPRELRPDSRILVLFGGRNWPGEKTLRTFDFDELADRHQLILLSPSFKDREYWEPEAWSGKALLQAVALLESRLKLRTGPLYLYGYSAGGQCAALFADWLPQRVAAWGAHGCGVYPAGGPKSRAPALISCGDGDVERSEISRHFAYRYREAGGALLRKNLSGGHEWSPVARRLALAWLAAVLRGARATVFGEDDTGLIRQGIDPEFRNPLYTDELQELWRR